MIAVNFLITYPQKRMSESLKEKLADVSDPLYCPLRLLQPVTLTVTEIHTIQEADYFVITSQFALSIYLKKLITFNRSAGLIVLSKKMAQRVRAIGKQAVIVAPEENQRSLVPILKSLTGYIIVLSGNLTLSGNSLPKTVETVRIYENKWDFAMQETVAKKLANKRINRVLVTSPSGYQRLKEVEKLQQTSFIQPTYYVLGEQTAGIIYKDHKRVIKPDRHIDVLKQMIDKMCQDERKNN